MPFPALVLCRSNCYSTRVDSRDLQTSKISIENTIVWERWYFWTSEINIDYRLILCIRGFCSSPLPIFKLSQVPWIDSNYTWVHPLPVDSTYSVGGTAWLFMAAISARTCTIPTLKQLMQYCANISYSKLGHRQAGPWMSNLLHEVDKINLCQWNTDSLKESVLG